MLILEFLIQLGFIASIWVFAFVPVLVKLCILKPWLPLDVIYFPTFTRIFQNASILLSLSKPSNLLVYFGQLFKTQLLSTFQRDDGRIDHVIFRSNSLFQICNSLTGRRSEEPSLATHQHHFPDRLRGALLQTPAATEIVGMS